MMFSDESTPSPGMMAWVQSENHCGIGPVFQENRDPKSIEFLFQMVHNSVITKFTIYVDGIKWVEDPVVAIQSNSRDEEVILGLENYMAQKGWPNERYTGRYI